MVFQVMKTQQPGSYKIQGSLTQQLARGRHLTAPKGLSPTCEKTFDTKYTIKTAKTIVKLDIIVPRLFLNQYKNISSLSSLKINKLVYLNLLLILEKIKVE